MKKTTRKYYLSWWPQNELFILWKGFVPLARITLPRNEIKGGLSHAWKGKWCRSYRGWLCGINGLCALLKAVELSEIVNFCVIWSRVKSWVIETALHKRPDKRMLWKSSTLTEKKKKRSIGCSIKLWLVIHLL